MKVLNNPLSSLGPLHLFLTRVSLTLAAAMRIAADPRDDPGAAGIGFRCDHVILLSGVASFHFTNRVSADNVSIPSESSTV